MDLWLLTDGSDRLHLTNSSSFANLVGWSPDGRGLAARSFAAGLEEAIDL